MSKLKILNLGFFIAGLWGYALVAAVATAANTVYSCTGKCLMSSDDRLFFSSQSKIVLSHKAELNVDIPENLIRTTCLRTLNTICDFEAQNTLGPEASGYMVLCDFNYQRKHYDLGRILNLPECKPADEGK